MEAPASLTCLPSLRPANCFSHPCVTRCVCVYVSLCLCRMVDRTERAHASMARRKARPPQRGPVPVDGLQSGPKPARQGFGQAARRVHFMYRRPWSVCGRCLEARDMCVCVEAPASLPRLSDLRPVILHYPMYPTLLANCFSRGVCFVCCSVFAEWSILQDGCTPLWAAAFNGRLKVVQYLWTDCKADPNQPNKVLRRPYGACTSCTGDL